MGFLGGRHPEGSPHHDEEILNVARLAVNLLGSVSKILCRAKRGSKRSPVLATLDAFAHQLSNSTRVTLEDSWEIETASYYLLLRIVVSSKTTLNARVSDDRATQGGIVDLLAPVTILLDVSHRIEGLISAKEQSGDPGVRPSGTCRRDQGGPAKLWRKIGESQEALDKQVWLMSCHKLFWEEHDLDHFQRTHQHFNLKEAISWLLRTSASLPPNVRPSLESGPQSLSCKIGHRGSVWTLARRQTFHTSPYLQGRTNEHLAKVEFCCRRSLQNIVLGRAHGPAAYLASCRPVFSEPYVSMSTALSKGCPAEHRPRRNSFASTRGFGVSTQDLLPLLDFSAWWIEQTQQLEPSLPQQSSVRFPDSANSPDRCRQDFWSSGNGVSWEKIWAGMSKLRLWTCPR